MNILKDKPLRIIFFLSFFLMLWWSAMAGDIEEYEDFGMPIVDPLILALIIFIQFGSMFFISTKNKNTYFFLFSSYFVSQWLVVQL
jgi:hypothetical protein